MRVFDLLVLLVAALLAGFGLIMGLGSILLFFDASSEYSNVELLAMVSFLSLLPLAGGFGLGFYTLKKTMGHRHEKEERSILNLAAQCGGKLSVAEVAARTRYSSDQAAKVLDAMHQRGLNEMEVTEGGAIIYKFPGFVNDTDKQKALGYGE